jgi:hypothetical protein
MLVWYVLLLRLARRPERTLQTTTAVFGYQMVLTPLLVTLQWLVQRLHGNSAGDAAGICRPGAAGMAVAANSHRQRGAGVAHGGQRCAGSPADRRRRTAAIGDICPIQELN